MKKFLILAVLTAMASTLWSAPVDLRTAQATAQSFVADKARSGRLTGGAAVDMKLLHQEMSATRATRPVYYIFNSAGAFVIVPADDRAGEVLAYGEGDLGSIPGSGSSPG